MYILCSQVSVDMCCSAAGRRLGRACQSPHCADIGSVALGEAPTFDVEFWCRARLKGMLPTSSSESFKPVIKLAAMWIHSCISMDDLYEIVKLQTAQDENELADC